MKGAKGKYISERCYPHTFMLLKSPFPVYAITCELINLSQSTPSARHLRKGLLEKCCTEQISSIMTFSHLLTSFWYTYSSVKSTLLHCAGQFPLADANYNRTTRCTLCSLEIIQWNHGADFVVEHSFETYLAKLSNVEICRPHRSSIRSTLTLFSNVSVKHSEPRVIR